MKHLLSTLCLVFSLHFLLYAQLPNENAPLGINLAPIASYQRAFAFVDVFKSSREWLSAVPGGSLGEGGELNLDENGWIISLDTETNQYAGTILADALGRPHGTYTVFFDGEGMIDIREGNDDASVVTDFRYIAPGHYEFDIAPDMDEFDIYFYIFETDPNQTGDYIRNIRVIMPGHLDTYETAPFYPPFLELWGDFKVLRFMDWQRTNNNPTVTWSERTTPQYATQATHHGVSLEYIIQLANTLKTDIWVCIPHFADDDYVTNFATMLRDDLDPTLKIYVEYSNEVWNNQFSQYDYAFDQGNLLELSTDQYQAQRYYIVYRSKQVHDIFENVFGGTERFCRLVAYQYASPNRSRDILDYAIQIGADLEAFAIAPYFGGNYGHPDFLNEIVQLTTDELLDLCEEEINQMAGTIQRQYENASTRGLNLLAYEGGQHLRGVYGAQNNEDLTNLFIAANRHPRMGELYMQYYQQWKCIGGDMFCHFDNMGEPSETGSWGLLESYEDDYMAKPKYAATMQFMEMFPAPWESPVPISVGDMIINFDGTELLSNGTFNRSWTPMDDGNGVFAFMMPLSLTEGEHIFECSDYTQGEFYGGHYSQHDPALTSNPPTYILSADDNPEGWAPNQMKTTVAGNQGFTTEMRSVILWKKEQFLNGHDQTTNVNINKLSVNIADILSDGGGLRFLIKNNGTYYISSQVKTSTGEATLEGFNNSSKILHHWKPITLTSTDFNMPSPMMDFSPVTFNNVEEVGFMYKAIRGGYGHNFGFSQFQAFTTDPTAGPNCRIDQAATQSDPYEGNTVNFTAIFSESVTGFEGTDIQLEGTARPTTAVVTEIAPMDGTTYNVEVSGMSLTGSVLVNIPEDVAQNGNGMGNQRASTSDNIIQFNISNPPTATINVATHQADPALSGPLDFTVVFSESMTGFDENDVELAGTSNPSGIVVTEIDPMDGTTYNIQVSGMDINGTVEVCIPKGSAINSLGFGNLDATTDDNVIDFYVNNPPLVTIDLMGHTDPAFGGYLFYEVKFNQSVTGFDANDVQLSGDAFPTIATVTEVSPMDGTTYRASVSGMTADGMVRATIPADAAENSEGVFNLKSTSLDNDLFYYLEYPLRETVINFQGVNIPDNNVVFQRQPEAHPTENYHFMDFSTEDGEEIYITGESQSEFYGGAFFDYDPSSDATIRLQLRNEDAGSLANMAWGQLAPVDLDPSYVNYMKVIFLWKKRQFLNNMDIVPVAFDNTTDSYIQANMIAMGASPRFRFVIRNGADYYISEFEATSPGLVELREFNNSDLEGKRWHPFDPNTDFLERSITDFSGLAPAVAMDFTDVQEVGFALRGRKIQYGQEYKFDAFTVNAINPLGPLSLAFTSFDGENKGGKNHLYWTIEDVGNVETFEIERSRDGRHFESIGQVEASRQNNYSFVDKNVIYKNTYYRLKWTLKDGKTGYSKMILLSSHRTTSDIKIHPNPVSGQSFYVTFAETTEREVELEILDVQGRVVLMGKWGTVQGRMEVNLDYALHPGLYFVKVLGVGVEKLVVD